MSNDKTTPEVEVKETDSKTTEEAKETKDTQKEEAKGTEADTNVEPTVEELLADKEDTVPLSTFLDTKNEKKALEKEIKELKAKKDDGATKTEVNSSLKDIADKYDVDPKFLGELSEIIYVKAQGDVEEKLNSKLKPLEAKERQAKIDKIFNENYTKVMETMPEYKDIVDKDTIKTLALSPANSKKTFQQLIEETYRNTVPGKKTMETSTPRGGKDVSLDMDKINTDAEYKKTVLADPILKKKYNDGLLDRIGNSL